MTDVKAEEVEVLPINAKFKDRIPAILEELCDALIVMEPHITRSKVAVDEFLDYLDFEISKTKLEISSVTWESKADPEQLTKLKDWLGKLEEIRKDFEPGLVSGSPDFINELTKRIRDTFQ